MAVKLSPVYNEATLDTNGNPWSGAQLFTYVAGSVGTKQTTYQDSAAGTPHTNPIILNARGEPPAPIWITSGVTYKFVLASPTESDPPVTPTRSVDNVSGVNDTTVAQDEWVSGAAPTYVSATSFTLVGDQRTVYHVGRRLKTTNTGGTVYSTISISAFGAVTTITVVNDSGTLDSGLSAVSYGLLSAANPSTPTVTGLLNISAVGAGQIKFPAAQNASTNANTLDDYEEGTFTPAVTFATPGDLAVTYSTQLAAYVKVGKQVTVSIFLDTSSFTYTTASGNLTVSGLPFAAQATGGWLGTMAYTGIALGGFTQFVPIVVGSASSIIFYGCGTGVSITNITTTHFASGGGAKTLNITLTYMASA